MSRMALLYSLNQRLFSVPKVMLLSCVLVCRTVSTKVLHRAVGSNLKKGFSVEFLLAGWLSDWDVDRVYLECCGLLRECVLCAHDICVHSRCFVCSRKCKFQIFSENGFSTNRSSTPPCLFVVYPHNFFLTVSELVFLQILK